MPTDTRQPPRILIVEDEPLIALTLEDVLRDAGYAIAGVTGKLDQALALIESGACDAAVVDANLNGISASPAAAALAARGLPFITMSGYSREQLEGDYPGAVFMAKPFGPELFIATLDGILPRQRPVVTELTTPQHQPQS
jgi:DNA-binding response OmpR family regulator